MKIFVDSPLGSQNEDAVASFTWHILGVYDKTSRLRHYRRTDFTEDIDSCMR